MGPWTTCPQQDAWPPALAERARFPLRALPAVSRDAWGKTAWSAASLKRTATRWTTSRLPTRRCRHLPARGRSRPHIPFEETIVYQDDDLVVADKTALPASDAGRAIRGGDVCRCAWSVVSVIRISSRCTGLDRATAGLVVFLGTAVQSRRVIRACSASAPIARPMKRWRRLCPGLRFRFPAAAASSVATFFRTCEVEGPANATTHVDVIARGNDAWRYRLEPVTGRKHQLRVHMAALGAPILGDPMYPELREEAADFSEPAPAARARALLHRPVHR